MDTEASFKERAPYPMGIEKGGLFPRGKSAGASRTLWRYRQTTGFCDGNIT